MEDSGRRTNHVVEKILYHTLESLVSNSDLENIMIGVVPFTEIKHLPIKNGRSLFGGGSVFNKYKSNHDWQPQVGPHLFINYLLDVAKKGTPITLDPSSGVVQAEIKKKALRGQEFPLTDGLWFLVKDGELSLYRNKEDIKYGDL